MNSRVWTRITKRARIFKSLCIKTIYLPRNWFVFISVSLLTNTVAILGTWKINSSCKSRSLKLLVCNFGIYFLLSVNIALVFTYPYLNRSIKKTFINAHLSTIILFVLLGSCFQGITAIDRYLIVRRGKIYLLEKHFCWSDRHVISSEPYFQSLHRILMAKRELQTNLFCYTSSRVHSHLIFISF